MNWRLVDILKNECHVCSIIYNYLLIIVIITLIYNLLNTLNLHYFTKNHWAKLAITGISLISIDDNEQ